MPMSNQDLITKQALQTIKKDVSLNFPSGDAQGFLTDTINTSTTLKFLEPLIRNTPAGKLDILSVGRRKLREADGSDTSAATTDGINKSQIPYAVHKLKWDTWIKNDDVTYTLLSRGGQNAEEVIIGMLQEQFAVDMNDLLWNADTATPELDADYEFLSIFDGFIKKITTTGTNKTDLLAVEPTILDFVNHVQMLPEKYRNKFASTLTWFISQTTHDKLVSQIVQRQTGYGDAMLVDGKLTKIIGYPVKVVEDIAGFACLTPKQNIKPVITLDMKYTRTATGATAASKDATYHVLFAHLDAVIREMDGVAYMVGEKL